MSKRRPLTLTLLSGAVLCLGQELTPPRTTAVQIKLVKGIPFSANSVTNSTQTLADGTHITRNTTALIARDSEGRTRREQKLGDTGAPIIFIQDPVAGVAYVLDTQALSVRKIPVRIIESPDPPVNNAPLSTQSIEGFLAEGTRLRKTIPANQAGNDQPLEVTSETWYSRDLQIVVMHRLADPRVGEVEYKLTGIQLGEPAESLFQVPKDYTVQGDPPQRLSRIKPPPAQESVIIGNGARR